MKTTKSVKISVLFLIGAQIVGLTIGLNSTKTVCQEKCHPFRNDFELEMSCYTTIESWLRGGRDCVCDYNGCFSGIVVPPNITRVTLFKDKMSIYIKKDSFQGQWKAVKHLLIVSDFIKIYPTAFLHLNSLQSLTISSGSDPGWLIETPLSLDIFRGLDNLLYLKFVNIRFVDRALHDMYAALRQPSTMKKLQTFELEDYLEYYHLNILIRSVSEGRNLDLITIKNVTVSHMYMYLDDLSNVGLVSWDDLSNVGLVSRDDLSNMGLVSRELSVSHSIVDTLHIELNNGSFKQITFPNTIIERLSFDKEQITIDHLSFRILLLLERYGTTECPEFTLNDMEGLSRCLNSVTGSSYEASHCWKMYNPNYNRCSLRLNKIADNFNMIGLVAAGIARQIEFIELSSMNITYISLDVLPEHVQDISLSDNNLGAMQIHEADEFQNLFSRLHMLSKLNMDRNQLSNLPYNIFSKNIELETLLLSGNYFQTFNVNIKHLKSLRLVDLTNNNIQIVDGNTQNILEQMRTGLVHLGLRLDMSGNPYKCSCNENSLQSIKWIKSLKALDTNKGKYMCYLDDQVYNIHGSALSATQGYCKQQEMIRLLLAILIPIAVFIALCVSVSFTVKRYIDKKRKMNMILQQIKNHEFPWQYLVFLSFCSDDEDFVMNMIYPQLTMTVADITKTNIELVCVGDKHFTPGRPLGHQIVNTINKSAVMLAVVSEAYCKKNWCQTEITEAYNQRKPIIMLMKDHVTKQQMGEFMGKIFDRYTHASWKPDDEGGHIEPAWPDFGKAIIELATTAHIEDEPTTAHIEYEPEAETNL